MSKFNAAILSLAAAETEQYHGYCRVDNLGNGDGLTHVENGNGYLAPGQSAELTCNKGATFQDGNGFSQSGGVYCDWRGDLYACGPYYYHDRTCNQDPHKQRFFGCSMYPSELCGGYYRCDADQVCSYDGGFPHCAPKPPSGEGCRASLSNVDLYSSNLNGNYSQNGELFVQPGGNNSQISCLKTGAYKLPSGNVCHDGACTEAFHLRCTSKGHLRYAEYNNSDGSPKWEHFPSDAYNYGIAELCRNEWDGSLIV